MESLSCCSDCKASKRLGHGGDFLTLLLWLHSFVLYPALEPFSAPPQGQPACFYSEAMHLCQGLFPALCSVGWGEGEGGGEGEDWEEDSE